MAAIADMDYRARGAAERLPPPGNAGRIFGWLAEKSFFVTSGNIGAHADLHFVIAWIVAAASVRFLVLDAVGGRANDRQAVLLFAPALLESGRVLGVHPPSGCPISSMASTRSARAAVDLFFLGAGVRYRLCSPGFSGACGRDIGAVYFFIVLRSLS